MREFGAGMRGAGCGMRGAGLYTDSVPDWDAERYHRVSDPQRSWGLRVLERLDARAGERILDIGCGTGRLTAEIASRVPGTRVVGVDRSSTMVEEAHRRAPELRLARADATRLPLRGAIFNAVFSTATFHWVHDHAALFTEIWRVLVPGGRLVAQAGGGRNLARLHARATRLAARDYPAAFEAWDDPWTFAGVDDTRGRLEAAGFSTVEVWLEEAPTTFADAALYTEFVSTVCLRHHLARLATADRDRFMRVIADQAAHDDPPYTLDYWRLNIDARKG
jgi:trans-aconitate 2-methyltransferase